MILNMKQDSTRKWVATVAASTMPREAFAKMIDADGWDCEAIDFRIMMNGNEVLDLDNMFDRLHDHVTKQKDRIEELEAENFQLRTLK